MGRPIHCPNCGKTWDYRICSKKHLNPPESNFCSECGSADLSECSGKEMWFSKFVGFVSRIVPELLLMSLIISILSDFPSKYIEAWASFVIPIALLFFVIILSYKFTQNPYTYIFSQIWKKGSKKIRSRGENEK